MAATNVNNRKVKYKAISGYFKWWFWL